LDCPYTPLMDITPIRVGHAMRLMSKMTSRRHMSS
jgi:hypothetical protein